MRQSVADNLASAQQMFTASRRAGRRKCGRRSPRSPRTRRSRPRWTRGSRSGGRAARPPTSSSRRCSARPRRLATRFRRCPGDHGSRWPRDRQRGPRATSWPRGGGSACSRTKRRPIGRTATDGGVPRLVGHARDAGRDRRLAAPRDGVERAYARDIALLSRGEAAIILNGASSRARCRPARRPHLR